MRLKIRYNSYYAKKKLPLFKNLNTAYYCFFPSNHAGTLVLLCLQLASVRGCITSRVRQRLI
jgi:hypothetical protein